MAIFTVLFFTGCSTKNKIIISDDWINYSKQIQGIIYPSGDKILIEDEKSIKDFLKIINGIEYDKSMTEEEAVELGLLPPGTEYNFALTNSKHDDKLYISYGVKDKALGIGDKVYILQEDISDKIDSIINDVK